MPYVEGSDNDNDFVERINRLTFEKILEIYNSNKDNLTLNIDFTGSGIALLKKKNKLNDEKKIKNRMFTIKYIIKKFMHQDL